MAQTDPKSDFESRALGALKEAGLRITQPRIQVIRALAGSDRALSVHAIHGHIAQSGGRIDVVSVYRTLATLVENHLVHHVGVVDGYLACGIGEKHGPVCEHLVCQDCGKVTELEVDAAVATTTSEALAKTGFRPREMKIEVLGLCSDCQT